MGGEPENISAVVFDLDDTLYPEREYIRSGYRAVARLVRDKLACDHPLEDWLWRRFCLGRANGALDAMNEHFALGLAGEDIRRLVEEYRRHTPTIQPYADVPQLLETLAGSCRLGMLSDGFLPAQRLKLEALKLGDVFEAVVFTEEMGRDKWKPSPDGFVRLAELLDTPHEACAYVADNPAKDFLAPNALGWLSVQFLRDGQVHAHNPAPPGGKPQKIVRSAEQLLEALRRRV